MKAKFKEYTAKIDYPVFGYTLFICFTDDIEAARQNQKSWLGALEEPLGPFVDGLHSYNKMECLTGVIFFKPSSTIGVVAHELFHALWRMFEAVGANLENETFAYHLSYSLDKVLEFREKNLKKFKTK